MKDINIWWEGPFSQEQIVENKIDVNKYNNLSDRIGLYQIYGTHPLYGNDVLLYIGRTKNKKGFTSRLKNRWVIENGNDSDNIKIYLGTIYSSDKAIADNEEEKLIDLSEVLLINALKPSLNSSNLQSVGKDYLSENYIVHNHNNYRNLYPILSSDYFWNSSSVNMSITRILAEEYNAEIMDENEYFMFPLSNESIFVGVEYECWNKTNQPLQIAISKELDKSIKNKIKNKFEFLDYEDEECFYISLSENLKDDNIIQKLKKIITKIENIITLGKQT